MPDINVRIQNKKITFKVPKTESIICCNANYDIVFDFDKEWEQYEWKRVRFISDGYDGRIVESTVGSNNRCAIPPMEKATFVDVGVYVDDGLSTTPLRITCEKSILCE